MKITKICFLILVLVTGCADKEDEARKLGFSDAKEMSEMQFKGFKTKAAYTLAKDQYNKTQNKEIDVQIKSELAEKYSRCIGSYEYEKCVEDEKKFLSETDFERRDRASRLDSERDKNMELANKENSPSSNQCSPNVKDFLTEIAAENGIYLEKRECSFTGIGDSDLVSFTLANAFDNWLVVVSYNPSRYQFVKGTEWVMCVQKRNGNLENVGKRCNSNY